MNRFNAILAVFAILLIGWLIVSGSPSPPILAIPTSNPLDITGFEVQSPAGFVQVSRDANGQWQVDEPQEAIVETMARLILSSLDVFQELFQFDPDDNLAQYGLSSTPQYVVSFDSAVYGRRFTFFVGDATMDQQEYYAVFVNLDTGNYRGEWVYTIPAVYIERLGELFDTLVESSQQRGQTTVP